MHNSVPDIIETTDIQKLLGKELIIQIQNEPLKKICDLGCGTGVSTRNIFYNFPNNFITGINISEQEIDQAEHTLEQLINKNPNAKHLSKMIQFEIANYFNPMKKNNFDLVFLCNNIINQIYQNFYNQKALEIFKTNINNITNNNAKIIISCGKDFLIIKKISNNQFQIYHEYIKAFNKEFNIIKKLFNIK